MSLIPTRVSWRLEEEEVALLVDFRAIRRFEPIKDELGSLEETRRSPRTVSGKVAPMSAWHEDRGSLGDKHHDPRQRRRSSLHPDLREHGPSGRATKKTKEMRADRRINDLKLAYSEFYLMLVLLKNYQKLNSTGFRKILKKHDKLFETTRGDQWRYVLLFRSETHLALALFSCEHAGNPMSTAHRSSPRNASLS